MKFIIIIPVTHN